MNAAALRSMVGLTLTDPEAAARSLIALRLPDQARWLALALVSVLTVLVMRLTLMVTPPVPLSPFGGVMYHPVSGFLIQAVTILLLALAMARVGSWFGGGGRFADALVLSVWLEFLMVLVGGAQLVLLLTAPALTLVLAIAAVGLFVWTLVRFTAALHGFTNLWAVFAGIVGTFLALAILFAGLTVMLGIAPPMESL